MNLRERELATPSSVLQAIIEMALVQPHHSAASDLDRELSYAQLINEAARVGAALNTRGVIEGDRVALLIPNSVDFIAAALACLWIGAVFVPLAVTDPMTRLQSVVADAQPTLIITSSRSDDELPTSIDGVTAVTLDHLREDRPAPDYSSDPTRATYMIYTSGTTGKPKGVQIGDAAFAAATHSTAEALGLGRTTRTLCVSPFHFDGSYANLFPTLVSGGTVIMRPREALLYPRTFFNTVTNEQINYSGFTPSYLRLLLASPQISNLRDSTLETIALGGEACSAGDLRILWSKVPTIRVFNRYGPTETTIAVTNVELTPAMIEEGIVTMGRPHPGVSFVLVDDDGTIIESANRIGELYIGGVQLMDGYWADPDLTGTVMRRDVVSDQLLYRTGDLVYWAEDGNYVYVDRADRVIKRSGVRISLVELNTLMGQLDHVTAVSCLTFDREGVLGIVAFVATDETLSVRELRRAASTLIPVNMLPDRIELVAAMPLNRSNTLDESGLLTMAELRPFRPNSPMPESPV